MGNDKPTSKTGKESWVEERLFGLEHDKTVISKGGKTYTGLGNSPEESEKRAREKYEKGEEDQHLCYLTTACTSAMQLPDNCLELTVLRRFRDAILLPEPSGRAAVMDYYKMAPEIVKSIEARDDANRVWQAVYVEIQRAVSLILSGNFNQAFSHYQQMTLGLKEKFLR